MISFAVSFILGIASFSLFPFFPVSIIVAGVSTIILIQYRGADYKRVFLIILVFSLGLLYSFIRHDPLPEIRFPDREVYIEGTIIDLPEISKGKIRFTLNEVYIDGRKIQGKVRLFAISEGSYKYYLLPASGDRISAIAKLKEPVAFRNPGVYSYDFKKDGIVAIGHITQLQVTGRGSGLLAWISRKRQRLRSIIENSLSEDSASFHNAIIPGFKKSIRQDLRDSFSSTGLAHLLSISGTHFGLLAFAVFKIVKMFVKSLPIRILSRMTLYTTPTQIAIIITLPLMVIYAGISGASIPTIRSLIMLSIYMLALFLGRKDQWLNSLSIAAIIILLLYPDALFELSFQLSFLAVLSIGLVLEKRTRQKGQLPQANRTGGDGERKPVVKKIFERVQTATFITTAAVLGTAPFVALFFKQFPLISPITNLIITPIVCFVILPLGFFTGFIALLFNMSTLPLNTLTDVITNFALDLIKVFSNIPYSNLHVSNPSFATIFLYFLSLIFVLKSGFRWRFLPITFILCLYIIRPYLSDGDFRITFLDIGQGDASVIELPDNRVILIDGGSESVEAGRRVIAPYLWSKGIRSLDYLVLSHPHYDHYGGLIYILDNFYVREIWLNGSIIPETERFLTKISEKGIPFRILRRGDVIEARDYQIFVLHPYNGFYADSSRGEFSNENSDSLVLKIGTGSVFVLFAGDVEMEAEEDLVHLGKWLKSDIIKVPHHGGRTSSTEEFIRTVSPEIAVISVGRHNAFKHPHTETLRRYKDTGVRFYRTDIEGAIILNLRDNGYKITTYLDSRLKRVHRLGDEIRNIRLLL